MARRIDIYGGKNPIDVPAYLVREAAHYLSLPATTVRAWVRGQRGFRPVIAIADARGGLLSFRNLIEVHVLSAIRRVHRVNMSVVRGAVKYLERELDMQHPLADARMLTDGKELFVERLGKLRIVSQHGQLAMKETLEGYLQRVERDVRGVPLRLFPVTSTRPLEEQPSSVVIDPRVQFGRPCMVGTGVPTSVVAERFKAGDSIECLSEDYGQPPWRIQEALRCELLAA